MPLSADVRREITRLVDERGWSGRDLAKHSGMTQAAVARKLKGPTAFDLDDLQLVCAALGVTVTDLLAWAEKD